MNEPGASDELDRSLLKVAADPRQVGGLHSILGDFCHQFRNRLHSVNICIYLFSRAQQGQASGNWLDLVGRYRELERLFEQVHTFCRPARLGLIRFALGGIFEERKATWTAWLGKTGGTLALEPPQDEAVGRFDPTRLTEALDGLVAWRARSGVGCDGLEVTIAWGLRDDRLFITFNERSERPRQAGEPATEQVISLALPVAARVVADHGGRLELEPGDDFKVRMSWPREAGWPNATGPGTCEPACSL